MAQPDKRTVSSKRIKSHLNSSCSHDDASLFEKDLEPRCWPGRGVRLYQQGMHRACNFATPGAARVMATF